MRTQSERRRGVEHSAGSTQKDGGGVAGHAEEQEETLATMRLAQMCQREGARAKCSGAAAGSGGGDGPGPGWGWRWGEKN